MEMIFWWIFRKILCTRQDDFDESQYLAPPWVGRRRRCWSAQDTHHPPTDTLAQVWLPVTPRKIPRPQLAHEELPLWGHQWYVPKSIQKIKRQIGIRNLTSVGCPHLQQSSQVAKFSRQTEHQTPISTNLTQSVRISQGTQSKDNDTNRQQKERLRKRKIYNAWWLMHWHQLRSRSRVLEEFQITSHIVGFRSVLRVVNWVIVPVTNYSILTCTRIP